MTVFDKILGAFLFFIALPAAVQADVHWLAVVMLIAACLVFLGFVVQAKKERCKRCGYYYPLNGYEAYVKKERVERCSNCAPATDQATRDHSAVVSK